jgi:hypothetical protein
MLYQFFKNTNSAQLFGHSFKAFSILPLCCFVLLYITFPNTFKPFTYCLSVIKQSQDFGGGILDQRARTRECVHMSVKCVRQNIHMEGEREDLL